MDMSNATASGPSYGLLDIIFGSKPEESKEDGQDFQPLMNLIKALGKKDQGDPTEMSGNRTDKEMPSGKDSIERRIDGIPEMLINMGLLQRQAAMAEQIPAVDNEQPASRLETIGVLQPDKSVTQKAVEQISQREVNQMLQKKALPRLDEAEKKLLQEVNEKLQSEASGKRDLLVAANAMKQAEQDNPALALDPKVANLKTESLDLDKVKHARHGDTKNLNQETVQNKEFAAPDKMLNTEAYLKMHAAMKNESNRDNVKVSREQNSSALQVNDDASSSLLVDAKEQGLAEKDDGEQSKSGEFRRQLTEGNLVKDGKSHNDKISFSSDLSVGIDSTQHGLPLSVKDIFMPDQKPNAMRNVLVSEMVQSVNAQAIKGGGEVKLVIHPESLGEVKLKISTRDNKVDVQISAQNEQVASLIRDGSKDLEASLGSKNLALAKFDVQVSDNSSVAFTDTRNSFSDQFQNSHHGGGFFKDGSGGFSQWTGQNQSGGREFVGSFESSNEIMRKPPMGQSHKIAQRDSSRRLDVVA